MNMPTFYMTVGIPGSGKTYEAKKYPNVIHLSSDDTRRDFERREIEYDNQKVFDRMYKETKFALSGGHDVYYDATNLNRKRRKALLNTLPKCYKVCLLFVSTPDNCIKRNNTREGVAKVPLSVIYKMIKNFQCPYYYEGFDRIDIIYKDEKDDIESPFGVGDLMSFNQDNHHHSLTLGEHLDETAMYVNNLFIENKLTYMQFILLKTAALYHDIGKLYTQTYVNSKGETTEEAHYYNHDNYGAYIWLAYFGRNYHKSETLYITNLINWHMTPYLGWKESEKAKERDKQMIGEAMYEDIMILHQADKMAH